MLTKYPISIPDLNRLIKGKITLDEGTQRIEGANGTYKVLLLEIQNVPTCLVQQQVLFYLQTPEGGVMFFKINVVTKRIKRLTHFNQGPCGVTPADDPIYIIFDTHAIYFAIIKEKECEVHKFEHACTAHEFENAHDFLGMASHFLQMYGKSQENIDFIKSSFYRNQFKYSLDENEFPVFKKLGIL